MASALSTFNDFVNVTGPAYLTSAEAVVNEAQKQNYILRRFVRGKDPSEIIQGGSTIKDTILFDEDSTFQYYEPNETFTWENPQVLTNWEINWRFGVDHMSWTDQEIELNLGGGLSRGVRHHMYKRLKRTKEQRLWTSIINGIEDQLFAVPRTAAMETATGKQPYSIPAMVNEETNGLFFSTDTPSGETAWTTKQGINPVTETKWKPQQKTYSSSAVNNAGNIISKFDEMFLDVRFVPPPSHQEYFESPHLNAQFIACSKRGQTVYQQLLRESQDTFVTPSRQDPAYMKPQFGGIDLEYVPNLDTLKLYDADSGTGDTDAYEAEIPTEEAGANQSGPRYYWLNAWYIKPVWHTTRYMFKHPVRVHPNQPFTHICPVDCWYNLVTRSLQRQGIVSPSGSRYT
jgi:hypothetical protein